MEREMRRKDRQITEGEALRVLEQAEYGVLSTVDGDGQPYGVPLSHVMMDGALYFHCAMEGHKLENLSVNPRVSFCAVTGNSVHAVFGAGSFGTEYEDAVLFGAAEKVEEPGEKNKALLALCEKYLPEHMAHAQAYVDKAGAKTAVYKIVPDRVTGKARRAQP